MMNSQPMRHPSDADFFFTQILWWNMVTALSWNPHTRLSACTISWIFPNHCFLYANSFRSSTSGFITTIYAIIFSVLFEYLIFRDFVGRIKRIFKKCVSRNDIFKWHHCTNAACMSFRPRRKEPFLVQPSVMLYI